MDVIRYNAAYEKEWDAFVKNAKNGHFMFIRQYMEYHSHKYKDESLLFFNKQKLVAVLPAHVDEAVFATHKGLTFGGVLCDATMTFALMKEVFNSLKEYLLKKEISSIFYKAIPSCYHKIPACEDLAVLTKLGAEMTARDLISVVSLDSKIEYYRGVRWSIRRAQKLGLQVRESNQWDEFMEIMTSILQSKYNRQPAHTAAELKDLADKFPLNIKLYGVFKDDLLLGGSVLYITEKVVHAQYNGMSQEGKKYRALPYLIDTLYSKYKGKQQYFSFGSSQDEEYINESLYYFKESMGARAMLQEQYMLSFGEATG